MITKIRSISAMDSRTLVIVLKNPYVAKKILEFFRNSTKIALQDGVIKIANASISKGNRRIDDFV